MHAAVERGAGLGQPDLRAAVIRSVLILFALLSSLGGALAQVPMTGGGLSSPAGVLTPTTIFSASLNGSDETTWPTYSLAVILPTTGDSLGHIAVSIGAGGLNTLNISSVYYCVAATPPSCLAAPVALKFGGSSSVSIAASGTATTDFAVFAPAGTTVIVCMDFPSSGSVDVKQGLSVTGASSYYTATGGCSSQTRTGWTSYNVNISYSVSQIQTE